MIILQVLGILFCICAAIYTATFLQFLIYTPYFLKIKKLGGDEKLQEAVRELLKHSFFERRKILREIMEAYEVKESQDDETAAPSEIENPSKKGDRGKRSGGIKQVKISQTYKTTRY